MRKARIGDASAAEIQVFQLRKTGVAFSPSSVMRVSRKLSRFSCYMSASPFIPSSENSDRLRSEMSDS